MKVTDKDVAYVAELAHIDLSDSERVCLLRDLNSILDYMDRLNRLDTTGVPPMAQTLAGSSDSSGGFPYATREDIAGTTGQQLDRDAVLREAPESNGVFFKVPKVIEK